MNNGDSFLKRRYELRKGQLMSGLNFVKAWALNTKIIPPHVKTMIWKPLVADELEDELKDLTDQNKALMDDIQGGQDDDDSD